MRSLTTLLAHTPLLSLSCSGKFIPDPKKQFKIVIPEASELGAMSGKVRAWPHRASHVLFTPTQRTHTLPPLSLDLSLDLDLSMSS